MGQWADSRFEGFIVDASSLLGWPIPADGQKHSLRSRRQSAQSRHGVLGHAYTDETQTIWNGIVGKIELTRVAEPTLSIRTHPLRVDVPGAGRLVVSVEPLTSDLPEVKTWSTETAHSGEVNVDIDCEKLTRWSEFEPALYRVSDSNWYAKPTFQDRPIA